MNSRLLCLLIPLFLAAHRAPATGPDGPAPYDIVTAYTWNLNDSANPKTVVFHPNGWGELTGLGRGGMWHLNAETGSVTFDEIGEKAKEAVHYQFWFYDNFTNFSWMEYRFHHQGIGFRGPPIGGVVIAPASATLAAASSASATAAAALAPAPAAAALVPASAVRPAAPPPNQIEILKAEGPNITAWVTSPLETGIPDAINENLLFMREALRDEQAAKPARDTAAYGAYSAALRYVSALIRDMEKRKGYEAAAGGEAVLFPHSNLTRGERNHLTWPQYALERAEMKERHQQAAYAKPFIQSRGPERWEKEDQQMRFELNGLYVEFREYLRETAKR